jgi:hypothetical protein
MMDEPTLTVPETNIGGYINTGWDSLSNLVGVTAARSLGAMMKFNSRLSLTATPTSRIQTPLSAQPQEFLCFKRFC